MQPENPLPPEVSVAEAAKYLGTTERTIINYLQARQLTGQKVGKRWFVKTASLYQMKTPEQGLHEASLPPIENPKSRTQQQNRGGSQEWNLVKTPKRHPLRVATMARVQEALILLQQLVELTTELRNQLQNQLLEIGEDLGAGYYSYGVLKQKLYTRARLRAGRLVAKAILHQAPQGFILQCCQIAELSAVLCRSLERRLNKQKSSAPISVPKKEVGSATT